MITRRTGFNERAPLRQGLAWSSRIIAVIALAGVFSPADAQGPVPGVPYAELVPTTTMVMPAEPDSNSPVVWTNAGAGGSTITVFHSTLTGPAISRSSTLMPTAPPTLVDFVVRPPYNVWFESVLVDTNGTWFAYYHYEVPASTVCPNDPRHMPSIGSARSFDNGQTWEDLGVILEAPVGSQLCTSPNLYFVGGVGDFSAALNPVDNQLYLFFSQYSRVVADQGIAVARIAWSDRNAPVGKLSVFRDGRWERAYLNEGELVPGATPHYRYKSGTPLFPTTRSWHAGDHVSNAFWGPSVHWNTAVNNFVMLMNHTSDVDWTQEGVYVTFPANSLTDWTYPQRLIAGGGWYPQVIGTEVGTGTDKLAGDMPRLFIRGVSTNLINFTARTTGGVKPLPIVPGTSTSEPTKMAPIESPLANVAVASAPFESAPALVIPTVEVPVAAASSPLQSASPATTLVAPPMTAPLVTPVATPGVAVHAAPVSATATAAGTTDAPTAVASTVSTSELASRAPLEPVAVAPTANVAVAPATASGAVPVSVPVWLWPVSASAVPASPVPELKKAVPVESTPCVTTPNNTALPSADAPASEDGGEPKAAGQCAEPGDDASAANVMPLAAAQATGPAVDPSLR